MVCGNMKAAPKSQNLIFADVPVSEEEKPQNILGTMLRYGSYLALTSGMFSFSIASPYYKGLQSSGISFFENHL